MTSKSLSESIIERFPHFEANEHQIIEDLFQYHSVKDNKNFNKAKQQFLDLLYDDLVAFYKWDIPETDRIHHRQRLLNTAGLIVIVPIEELREVSHHAKLKQKKIVFETVTDPVGKDRVEFHSYDLKYVDRLSDFLAEIQLEPQKTALDYLSGNREKRMYPQTQYTVFLKKLSDEVISNEAITASAEPLTQTQLISLYDMEGELRDMITIGFDLMYEAAYIDFFHHAPLSVTPLTLLRNTHIACLYYLKEALTTYLRIKKQNQNVLEVWPLFLGEIKGDPIQKTTRLVNFISEQMVTQIEKKIETWNTELNLAPQNRAIYWGE